MRQAQSLARTKRAFVRKTAICLLIVSIVPFLHIAVCVAQVASSSPDGSDACPVFFKMPFTAEERDAYAQSPGIPLELSRVFPQSYANPPQLGPLGYGWIHSFDLRLENSTEGLTIFREADGSRRYFRDAGDGSFIGSPGETDLLIHNSTSGYFVLIEKSGLSCFFRPDMLLDLIIDSNANFIKATYDEKGRLSMLNHSCGIGFRFEYNKFDRISELIDHTGRRTSYEYSPEGDLLLKVIYPDKRETSYAYGMNGTDAHRLIRITSADGSNLVYSYDSKGRLASQEKDSGLERVSYRYGPDCTTHILNALGEETIIRVNERGQTTEIKGPAGNITRYEYNSKHQMSGIVDPLGHSFNLSYDDMGNVFKITSPDGGQNQMGYDPKYGRMTLQKDPLGKVTKYSYDSMGNLLSITYPDNSTESFSYREDGLLAKRTKRDGGRIGYNYDRRGLLLSKDYSDGTYINYTYDKLGRMTGASDSIERITFEYDTTGNLIRVTYPGERTFRYEYDSAGRRTAMTYPDGSSLAYEYNHAGRLLKIKDQAGLADVEYQYDDAGRRIKKTLGDGAYTTYQRDPAGRILRLVNYDIAGSEISHFYYSYDALGNVLTLDTVNGLESYTYDSFSRIASIRNPDGSEVKISYDLIGNRIKEEESSSVLKYSADDLGHYTTVGKTQYKYDQNGNLIYRNDNGAPTYYEYDLEDRLVNAETPEGEVSYAYDPIGMRSSRISSEGRTEYLWDGSQLAIEEDEGHNTKAKYIWGEREDEPVQMRRGYDTYYYAQDGHSSTSDLIDASGKPAESYSYSPFGEPKRVSTVGNQILFSGAMFEPVTGLISQGNGEYSASLGRSVSSGSYSPGKLTVGDIFSIRLEMTDEGLWQMFWFFAGLFPVQEGAKPIWDIATHLIPIIWNPLSEEEYGRGAYRSLSGSIADMPRDYRDVYLNGDRWQGSISGAASMMRMPVYRYTEELVPDLPVERGQGTKESPNLETPKPDLGLDLGLDNKKYFFPPPQCPPNCPDKDGGGGVGSVAAPGSEGSLPPPPPPDQSGDWKLKSITPIPKSGTDPLSSALSGLTDALQGSADRSSSGSYKVKVEEDKGSGDKRFTVYQRPVSSGGSPYYSPTPASAGSEDGWRPLPAPEARAALSGMGYAAPSISGMQASYDYARMVDQTQLIRDSLWQSYQFAMQMQRSSIQSQQLNAMRNSIEQSHQVAMQVLRSSIQEPQWTQMNHLMDQNKALAQSLGGVDFSSIQINYISLGASDRKDFNYVLKAQKASGRGIDLRKASAQEARYFLTGLAIPNYKFWVNLNPWEPDRIVDKDLALTDVGRIMLEADLQMKKDFCNKEDPCQSELGKEFQKELEKKQSEIISRIMQKYPGEIKSAENIRFSTATRHWIVPDRVNIYGNDREIWIDNSSLKIYSEPVSKHSSYNVLNQDVFFISKSCLIGLEEAAKEYGNFTKELEDRMITTLVVRDVNSHYVYSDLRDVYVSLALAQWYKEHKNPKKDLFVRFVNRANITSLEALASWSPKEVWNRYSKSYSEGEYHCWQNKTYDLNYQEGGSTITGTRTESKHYSAGGVDFSKIAENTTLLGEMTPDMRKTVDGAIYTPVSKDGDEYFFGDGIYAE